MINFGATGFELVCLEGQAETDSDSEIDSDQLKIDFNIKDKYGWTGFHWACERDRIEIVELLIKNSDEKNIFLNAKDDFGWTGFHLACKSGRERIVQLLINNSGSLDLNAKSKDGRTGLQLAKIFSNFDIVELIESKMPSLAKENRKRKSMDEMTVDEEKKKSFNMNFNEDKN